MANEKAGMLSDQDILTYWKNGISIFTSENGDLAFDLEKQLSYGSIDLRFRYEYRKIKLNKDEILTYSRLEKRDFTDLCQLKAGEKLLINPGEIIFTTTLETVNLSEEFAGIVTGRSSIARLGIMVHCCQEFINPGHGQPLPLQLINMGPCPVELDMSVPVCQLVVFKLVTPASNSYRHAPTSKYADEISPLESKIYEEARSNITNEKSKSKRIKKFCERYILPFLPSAISTLFLVPIVYSSLNKTSIADFFTVIIKLPTAIIFSIGLIILYIWIKKGGKN